MKQELSYDAWGRLRDPATRAAYAPGAEPVLFLGRGYTGHEYLPWFGLINMNARLFDPALGRFLSPDPYVQTPDFTQSFNRYSYCLNNPLTYADPSGERTLLGKFFHWVGEQASEPWARGILWLPTMLAVAPSEIMSLDALGCGSFISNYIRGGFSEGMKAVGNSIEINAQVFDPGTEKAGWGKDLLLRFTYEGLNTGLGSLAANLTNSFSNVDDVQFYRGTTVLQTGGEWGAITFGNYIIGDNDIEAKPENYLFQHEFGHYLQSKLSGPGYFFEYGIPSLIDAAGKGDHDYYWVERDANLTALIYYNRKYPGYHSWHYIDNPIYEKGDKRNNKYPDIYLHRRTP